MGTDDRNHALRFLAAVHEAGHAVAVMECFPGEQTSVSIRQQAGTGGGVHCEARDELLIGKTLRLRLVALLSGRAAEEIVFGHPSSDSGFRLTTNGSKAPSSVPLRIPTIAAIDSD